MSESTDATSGLADPHDRPYTESHDCTRGELQMTTVTAPDFDAIKTRQQGTWSSGDYAVIGTTLQIVGETLCEAVDIAAGEDVLDVAAGNGNVVARRRPPWRERHRVGLRARAARRHARPRRRRGPDDRRARRPTPRRCRSPTTPSTSCCRRSA